MQKGIKNAIINGRNGYITFSSNNPHGGDSAMQYYADTTKAYYESNLKYASNMVLAQVQGVNYNDFYRYTPVRLRTAMVIDPTTGNNLGSDWQRVIAENGNIDFLPRGAKVVFGGNTWLVTNPMNVESVTGTSIICRCNATWNHLDAYGNVKREPFRYGQGAGELATTDSVKENMILLSSYQHAVMQYNPDTAEIAHNMRMILGNQAFYVRGLQNFAMEFTEDESSVHIQYFDLAKTEPLEIDDMERRVAGGKGFKWEMTVLGGAEMRTGGTQTLTVQNLLNGEPVQLETSYAWESSDDTVAEITQDGVVVGKSAGEAAITCTLMQNTDVKAVLKIAVTDEQTKPKLTWRTAMPSAIAQYESITIEAGTPGVDEAVTYTFDGPNETFYTAEADGNRLKITCWAASGTPLKVTAARGEESISAAFALEGW